MPLARIYKPTKTTMQSGQARAREWILEFEPASARAPDPLTGWTSTTDMDGQVRLTFETSEEAVAYAQRHEIAFPAVPVQRAQDHHQGLRRQLRR